MKTRPILFLCLLLILTMGAIPSYASAAALLATGPQIKATPAFEGYFKYGEWLPIWVELENQGQDVEGEVRILVSGSQGNTAFTAPVSLPAGSHKLFPVYVLPNNFSRELQVTLVNAKNTSQVITSQKVSIHPEPNISYFIGIVSPQRGALSLLSAVTLPGQDRPKVLADISLPELVDRQEGLRSFDVLILNNTDTSKLSTGQAKALLAWVQGGGRLILGGGSGAAQTFSGLPEGIQPVKLQGSIEIGPESVQELAKYSTADPIKTSGSFVAAVGQPIEEGTIQVGKKDLPLLVERAVGKGSVDFIALDVAVVPFNGWSGTQKFFETLLAPGSKYPEGMPFDISAKQMRASQLSYALSNIPSLDLPSVQGLSLLLGLYILVVGPLNYLVLRWQKRLHLAWVTIPVITILFAAGSFGIGYFMRGTDLLLNRISLIQVQPGGVASVTSYMGLFSPRQQSYEILVNGEGLVSPMSAYDNGGGWNPAPAATGGEMVFEQGTPSVIKGLTVNQFSMQSFVSEETWQDFGKITSNLKLENDVLKGTVKNDTAYTLKDVVVAYQNRFVRLGVLQPGQEAQVDLGLSDLTSDRFGSPLSYKLFQDEYNNPNGLSREVQLKTNLLSTVIDNGWPVEKMALSSRMPAGGPSNQSLNNRVIILGWMNQAPPNVEVKNNRLAQQTTALVYMTTGFTLASQGTLSLPVGMIPGNITKTPMNGGICGTVGSTSVSMANGEAEFEYQIPAEMGSVKVNTLKISLWSDNGGSFGIPTVSIWDWQSESWTSIKSPILGVNIIKAPDNFINEGGLIRIKLKSDSNQYSCTYIDLGMDGVPGTQGSAQ